MPVSAVGFSVNASPCQTPSVVGIASVTAAHGKYQLKGHRPELQAQMIMQEKFLVPPNAVGMQPYERVASSEQPLRSSPEPPLVYRAKKKSETYITSAFNVLPPCTVCGEKSSGMHYGVNTCEGCKGFFRRCTQKSAPDFQCIFSDGGCVVQGPNRNKCQYCRYRKCVEVGMSKGAIKIGRYTKELKIKNLQTAHQAYQATELRIQQPMQEEIPMDATPSDDTSQLLVSLLTLHNDTNEYNEEKLPGLLEKQREHLATRHINSARRDTQRLTENMSALLRDGVIKKGTRLTIQFSDGIPQFRELPVDDGFILLKNCVFEMWLLCATRTFNFEHDCFTLPDGTTVDRHTSPDPNLLRCLLDVAAKVKALQLTVEEMAILRAILLFTPERQGLKDVEKVRSVYVRLVAALRRKMARKLHGIEDAMTAISELRAVVMEYSGWLLGFQLNVDDDDEHRNGCVGGGVGNAVRARRPSADAEPMEHSRSRKTARLSADDDDDDDSSASLGDEHLRRRLSSGGSSEPTARDERRSSLVVGCSGGDGENVSLLQRRLQARVDSTQDYLPPHRLSETRLRGLDLHEGIFSAPGSSLEGNLVALDSPDGRLLHFGYRTAAADDIPGRCTRGYSLDDDAMSIRTVGFGRSASDASMSTCRTDTPDAGDAHFFFDSDASNPAMDLSFKTRLARSQHGNGNGADGRIGTSRSGDDGDERPPYDVGKRDDIF